MDILDIDEALKDDSFIFLEDKTLDDVSNILQQWRNNNYSNNQNQEQAFKLNTRTFTRPKRKSAQNSETQFSPPVQQSQNVPGGQNINLEIGGLVTTMQKSFLQDTSPPSSICSSMGVSVNGMNSSLITSADFANINFFQSTLGSDPMSGLIFDNGKITEGGYTLSDMIEDRKALESLTLSGEGTLIKDSNIAQIDDISLINSKTNSACSTMNNSTDSMMESGRICPVPCMNHEKTCTLEPEKENEKSSNHLNTNMNETFVEKRNIQERLIENQTFNKDDNDIQNLTTVIHDGTFQKSNVEESIRPQQLNATEIINKTFNCNETDEKCATPESEDKYHKFIEQSTPRHNPAFSAATKRRQPQTPSIKEVEVNISPIVAAPSERVLDATFEKLSNSNRVPTNVLKERQQINDKTFSNQSFVRLPLCDTDTKLALDTMDLLEKINTRDSLKSSPISVETPTVDASDEEAFDNLLDRIAKLELNEDQVKMRKSLDSIKKRFSHVGGLDKPEAKENSMITTSDLASSTISMNNSGSNDRLLNRRSRLYDNVQITKPPKSSPSGSANSISYVKETEKFEDIEEATKKTEDQDDCTTTSTESNLCAPVSDVDDKVAARTNKLEKRDRDRFKTIRIFKRPDDGTNELNVPCIDAESQPDSDSQQTLAVEDNELQEPESNATEITEHNKVDNDSISYATFKKPKEKIRKFPVGPSVGVRNDQLNRPVIPSVDKPTEQRSVSRPRYISGLQKINPTAKAVSAGDLEKAKTEDVLQKAQAPAAATDLKSPMGIKSKSFHNLSSNFGYNSAKAQSTYGVRKCTTAGNILTEKQSKLSVNRTSIRMNPGTIPPNPSVPSSKVDNTDQTVFKTPSLVSGLRGPSTKRTGLMRPSSGYYSFTAPRSETASTTDSEAGRHSPTDSMSSASSRGSSIGKNLPNTTTTTTIESVNSQSSSPSLSQQLAPKTSGIPKPSGIRPPSSIKRSGLPRPASMVRR